MTQAQREDLLLALVLQDVGALIPVAARAKGCTLVLERQRSSVLYSDPATAVDLTSDVLGAYDVYFAGLLEQHGREAVLQNIRDRQGEDEGGQHEEGQGFQEEPDATRG